jgi:hypothetical protein
MNVKQCAEMGIACDLTTLGEAYSNVRIHSANIFAYDKIKEEMDELTDEINRRELKPDLLLKELLKCSNSK